MKKNVLKWVLMLAVSGLATGAFAQSKLTDEQKEELLAKMEQFRTELNLSAEQQEKVQSINGTYFEGLAGLKASNGSKLAKFKQYRSLSETRDQQMKQALDKDQYKRYKAMQKAMKDELKNRRKP